MDTVPIPEALLGQVNQTVSVQPSQKKRSLKKFFNISSWVILFALLPVTVLIFLSQDTIPGDFFYPVKRGMENVILAAASVNPATRAAFRTDLTEARFKEAQSLVVSKANASGLTTFVDEVQTAKLEVTDLQSPIERQKAEERLATKIDEYQNGLSTLEAKTEQNIIAYQSQETPTPIAPTSTLNSPSATPTLILTPTLTPTSTPTPAVNPLPSSKPRPSPTLIATSIPIPTLTLAPTVVPQPENTQLTEQKKIAETIKDTKEKLDKIKKELEEKRKEREERRNEKNQKKNENSQNENKDASDNQK